MPLEIEKKLNWFAYCRALGFLLISAISQSTSVDFVCNFHESWIGRSCNLRAIKLTDEQTPIKIITTGTKKSLNEVIMVNIQYSQVKFIPNVIFEVFPNLTILKVDEDNRQLDNLQKHYFKVIFGN